MKVKGVRDGVRGSTLPNQPYFFGRDKELAIIADAIAPESRTWGALIDGPGGIGKTALAIRAAHIAPVSLFERKIFITAKVRELTPEGEKPLKDFSRDNYFSMLNELALELGEDAIPHLALDERANPLRIAMAGKKTLIVFDNLETLSEDERTRLFQFLTPLPEGNKAIVTSRRRADVDARVIRLDRLSADESLQLMEELAKNNLRLAREDKKARRNLYEITNGNPLLIKWICGQLGREGSAMRTIAEAYKFIENAPPDNDPLEYIFGDLLETLTDSEIEILASLTYFTEPAKVEWITAMSKLAENAVVTILEDLTDRSILISSTEQRDYYLPALAAEFIRVKKRERLPIIAGRLVGDAGAKLINLKSDEAESLWKLEPSYYERALSTEIYYFEGFFAIASMSKTKSNYNEKSYAPFRKLVTNYQTGNTPHKKVIVFIKLTKILFSVIEMHLEKDEFNKQLINAFMPKNKRKKS